MRIPTLPVFMLLLTVLAGCGKASFNDLGGTNTFNGVLLLYDTLAGSYAFVPVANQTIYLQNPMDTTAYLYSTKSNNLGQFSFTAFDSLAAYRIYAAMDSNHIHYTGLLTYTKYNQHFLYTRDSLVLTPAETSQNGIFYELTDSVGGRLSDARFFIYTSELLWKSQDSTGSNFRLTSDPFGRCLEINVAPGQYYYVHARDSISPTLIWNGSDTVFVASTGIRKKTLVLK